MTEENEQHGVPSAVIIAVLIAVLLSAAAVVAVWLPSGEPEQHRDRGVGVPVGSTAPVTAPADASVVRSQIRAEWLGEGDDAGPSNLVCTITLAPIPPERSSVVHVLTTGAGVTTVPLLHPGEEVVDAYVHPSDGPLNTFTITQRIEEPTGDYTCLVAAVMTAEGAARIEGRTQATVSAAG